MTETWISIKDYPGYEVSLMGDVKLREIKKGEAFYDK